MNLMLLEEYALINGDSTSTAAPWGDTSSAFAFDGIINLVTAANGTPAANLSTSVGALTTQHIENQLTQVWAYGGRNMWILCAAQEALSLTALAEAAGSLIRLMVPGQGADANKGGLGFQVGWYMHPLSGEQVPIIVDRFMPAGTMIFSCDNIPDGSPTWQVSVLPQVEMPALAPVETIQGYSAAELAPVATAPDVLPFLCSVYEVLMCKDALVSAKSTGISAA